MSNTTPDFSRDPECVDLAKAMRDAQRACDPLLSHWDGMEPYYQKMLLACADAAITLLGSGYHLPEATEANAERLAEAHWNSERGQIDINVTNEERLEYMLDALHALRAAFGEPEPAEQPAGAITPCRDCDGSGFDTRGSACCRIPGHAKECDCQVCQWMRAHYRDRAEIEQLRLLVEHGIQGWDHNDLRLAETLSRHWGEPTEKPATVAENATETCTATNGDHRCEREPGHAGEHSTEKLAWEEPSANDILDSEARINAQPAKDPVREGERRKERQELVLRFAIAMAGQSPADHVVELAVEAADEYLEWRDADNEKAMEAYRCKK